MARIQYVPNRVIDTNGISDGANIFVYQTGTTTPITIYSDEELTTPVSNPYPVAAGAAVPSLYHNYSGLIRVRVVASDGSVPQDEDPYGADAYGIISDDGASGSLWSTVAGFIAYLRSSVGSSIVGFIQAGTGAVARTMQAKSRDFVSVLDFGADNTATFNTSTGAVTGSDSTAAFQAALDTGKNVYVPAGVYLISDAVQIKNDGQWLFGQGTYTTTIVWTGTDNTVNMLELWSGRRDLGGSPAKTNQLLSGFLISSATGSAMASAVWVENGIFHSTVEHIRATYFHGEIADAAVKLDSGGGTSYPVGLTMRDVVITGINQTPLQSAAIPKGVWCESMIEAEFDMVKVFNVSDAFVFGSSGTFRTVEDCSFHRCHVEIGDRRGGANTATGMRFYGGSNLNFFGCKINAGINDDASWANVTDQTCVEFMSHADSHPMRNINFWGCRYWQVSLQTRELVYVNTGADLDKVLFDSPRVVGVTSTPGFIGLGANFDADIEVRNPNLSGLSKAVPLADMRGRRSVTHDAGSLTAGAFETFNLGDDDGSAFGLPVAVSANINRQGVHLSWYKTSATGVTAFSLWNPINGSTQDLPSGRYAIRKYQPEDIRATVSMTWDPPAINTNIGTTTTIACPGAQLGDFVKAGFKAITAGGLSSAVCEAWVSAANVVSVRLFNPNVNKNFASNLLTVFHLAPTFDYIATATYDPASLLTLTSTSTTVTVTGAVVGDFVEVSFSLDQAGVFFWGEVTAADTVTVLLFNSTTGTVDLASGTLTVGVRKRHIKY